MKHNLSETTDLTETFHILSNEKRRTALDYLIDNPESEVDELAEHLAAEHDDYRTNMLELQHNHLPRLADAEVIEYDGERVELDEDNANIVTSLNNYNRINEDTAVFEALSNERSFATLLYVKEHGRTPVDRISEELGENGVEMYNLEIQVHHAHAPRLEKAGLINYSGEDIEPTPEAVELMEDLEKDFSHHMS